MKCVNTGIENTVGSLQRNTESTGIVSRFRVTSNQLAYRNASPLTILIRSKTNIAKTRKKRVQD
jgi:hypothetical protein